jgi:hypothetical protein
MGKMKPYPAAHTLKEEDLDERRKMGRVRKSNCDFVHLNKCELSCVKLIRCSPDDLEQTNPAGLLRIIVSGRHPYGIG